MNHRSSWFSARNALEYYFWFKSRLHLHSRIGFIPLGGNTVFVRRPLLEAAGGWDNDCLAEDCDLGARLSARGQTLFVCEFGKLGQNYTVRIKHPFDAGQDFIDGLMPAGAGRA